MDIEHKPSEEEIQADAEAQAETDESTIRADLASNLGIEDDEDNADLLDKLVARDAEHRSKLSKAVAQKIKYRDGKSKPPADKSKKADPVDAVKLVEEQFMQRDLDEMDHSDTVKDQIKRIAQLQDISIRKAEQDSYIQHLISEEARQKSVNDAAKNGKGNSKSGTVIDVSKPLDASQFDLSTEEGRAEWADAKKAKRDAAANN